MKKKLGIESKLNITEILKSKKLQIILELLFCAICCFVYFYWSIHQQLDYAPDEKMRYDIPYYIFKHGKLPLGNCPELVDARWGFSYAYLPLWLGPLLSAISMKLVYFIFGRESLLVIAARFPSVVAGTITVFLMFRILGRLVDNRRKWLFTVLFALIPQYIFLSSYVNNDAINIMGAAMILYAWLRVIDNAWNMKNAILLCVGISVIGLSYYFAYGWVLCSIIFFFVTYMLRLNDDNSIKSMAKWAVIMMVIVLVFIAWAFIRNAIVYNGDFLGRSSMAAAQRKYAVGEYNPKNRSTLSEKGVPLGKMMVELEWFPLVFKSSVCILGYMNVNAYPLIYATYFGLFILSLIFIVSYYIELALSFNKIERVIWKKKMLITTLLVVAFIIPIVLNIIYSYTSDFQPQGRYSFSAIVAFIPLSALGFEWYEKSKNKKILLFVEILFIVGLLIYITNEVFLKSTLL